MTVLVSKEDLANIFSWYRGIVPTKRLSQKQVDDAHKVIDLAGIETFASLIGFDLTPAVVTEKNVGIDISEKGYALIKEFEGFGQKAYLDTGGVWTIGYGTIKYPNGVAVKKGDVCTIAEANVWMKNDCKWVVRCLREKIKTKHLTQNQYDSLGSFIYNVGETQFGTSTLLNLLNRGNIQGAASQFSRWVYDNGQRINGLVNRRTKEKELFLAK